MSTTESQPKVSIVIVCYNGRDDLAVCLPSILRQTYENFEIIAVDSGSSDDTVNFIRREFPKVELHEAHENLGFRRGNNVGFKLAKGKYVVLLNQDTEVAPDWLAHMVRVAEADEGIGLVVPKILLFDDRTRINEVGNTLHYSGMSGSRGNGEPASSFAVEETIACVSGCCFLVRRELLERLGGFSIDFDQFDTGAHASLEEVDLGWRAQLLGYQVRYTPLAILFHKYRAKPMSPERYGSYEWGRTLLVLRNYETRTLFWLAPVLLIIDAGMWCFAIVKRDGWLRVKWRLSIWFLGHIRNLREMRRRVQADRTVKDGVLLRRMSPLIQLTHATPGGPLFRALQACLDWLLGGYYRFLIWVVGN